MTFFKNLIHEAHRRSLWQVLGIYLAVSWVTLQVVETLTESAGMPDWVPPGALVLLLIGLPIVMATAFVQEGMGGRGRHSATDPGEAAAGEPSEAGTPGAAPVRARSAEVPAGDPVAAGDGSGDASSGPSATGASNLASGTGSLDRPTTRPSRMIRMLTWKHAMIGGVLAFAALGALVVSYWVMWATGVGPVGSLVAQGVLEEREAIILADFVNSTPEFVLGDVVTDALRVDLVESPVITLVDRDYVGQILRRMGRDPEETITPAVAREAAIRDGIKAVVEGEVSQVAGTYVLTATLVEAQTGRDLAAFRETAANGEEILAAIDKLSERLRERAGESLRNIRAMAGLEEVTTTSLDALKLYAEARVFQDQGEYEQAIDLLTQAVELDPQFSMAWRGIAISLGNMRLDRAREFAALERAYANRDQLTERERNLTIAHYHYTVTEDLDEVVRAYERVLDRNPDDNTALNNLSILYTVDRNEPAKAEELLTRAVNGPAETYSAHFNLVVSLFNQGKHDEAAAALARWMERFPTSADHYFHRTALAAHSRDWDVAEAVQDSAVDAYPGAEQVVYSNYNMQGSFEMGRGRLGSATQIWNDGFRRAVERGRADWAFRYARNLAAVELWFRDNPGRARAQLSRFDEAFALDDLQPLNRPYFGMVGSWSRTGDSDRAQWLLDEQDVALPPDEQSTGHRNRILTARANIALARGNASEAADLYSEYRRIERCGACFQEQLGEAQAELGEYEAAIESFEGWLNNPEFSDFPYRAQYVPVVLERLARLYEQIGEASRAAEYYEEFASYWVDPDLELQQAVETARSRAASLRASISD